MLLTIVLSGVLYGGLLKMGADMSTKTVENIKKIHEMDKKKKEDLKRMTKRASFK